MSTVVHVVVDNNGFATRIDERTERRVPKARRRRLRSRTAIPTSQGRHEGRPS
jgi:hypothetical protein